MNRSIQLHPLSLVAGVVFGVLVLLSMSQTPVLNARTVNVQYLPDPRDLVQISGAQPYTVPAGKIFVLTGLGATQAATTRLLINNIPEVTSFIGAATGFVTVLPVTTGFSIVAGTTFTMDVENGSPSLARAWGYLAPQ